MRAGKNGSLNERCGQRRALQALDRIEQRIEICAPVRRGAKQALPVGEEARQRVLLHRLDLAAQLGQRLAANLAQNLRVAPLAMKAAGTEAAFKHAAFVASWRKRVLRRSGIQRKAVRGLAQREGAVGARVAAHQVRAPDEQPARAKRGGRPGGSGIPSPSR
jgi:hypothetical protein